MSSDESQAIEDRLERLDRLVDGVTISMERLTRQTDRLIADNARRTRSQREWCARIEEKLELLDRAFGTTVDRLVQHAKDPDAHDE